MNRACSVHEEDTAYNIVVAKSWRKRGEGETSWGKEFVCEDINDICHNGQSFAVKNELIV